MPWNYLRSRVKAFWAKASFTARTAKGIHPERPEFGIALNSN